VFVRVLVYLSEVWFGREKMAGMGAGGPRSTQEQKGKGPCD